MAGEFQVWPVIEFGVIGDAWRMYKRHWFIWSLAMVIAMTGYSFLTGTVLAILKVAVDSGPGGFRLFLTPGSQFLPFLVLTVVSSFFLGGMVRMAGNQVRGRAPRLEDMFSVTDVWFDLILVAVLNGAATWLGFMLCAVPGLIVSGLFMLAIPLVVEGHLPATGALIQSWNVLKSQWLMAALFHVVLIVAAISGAALCGIGVVFTGPLYCLAISILYRKFFAAVPGKSWTKNPEPFPEF